MVYRPRGRRLWGGVRWPNSTYPLSADVWAEAEIHEEAMVLGLDEEGGQIVVVSEGAGKVPVARLVLHSSENTVASTIVNGMDWQLSIADSTLTSWAFQKT